MIRQVVSLFRERDPRREASLALVRIATLSNMDALPWETGVYDDRRAREETHAAIGVWLCPVDEATCPESVSLASAVPAVSYDLRSEGFGILTLNSIEAARFVVAVPNGPDGEESWKFFVTTVCHNTSRPGGWHQLGLRVERVLEPDGRQSHEFRDRITDAGKLTLVGAED